MKILVTGSKGFIAQNLIERLKENNNYTIFSYDIDSSLEDLDKFTKECDFVFHLAGVNRPKDEKEFMEGNYVFTSVLLNNLKKHNNKSPIMISSSTKLRLIILMASVKAAEDLMFDYEKETGNKIYIFRLDNVLANGQNLTTIAAVTFRITSRVIYQLLLMIQTKIFSLFILMTLLMH